MPPPLGFRTSDRRVPYSPRDKAVLKLIIAELDLLAMRNRENAQQQPRAWGGGFRKLCCALDMCVGEQDSMVTYEQVMVCVLCWRMPQMVPRQIHRRRGRSLHLVYATACARKVVSFLATLVSLRRRRAFRAHVERMQADTAFQRRLSCLPSFDTGFTALLRPTPSDSGTCSEKGGVFNGWFRYRSKKTSFSARMRAISRCPGGMMEHHGCEFVHVGLSFEENLCSWREYMTVLFGCRVWGLQAAELQLLGALEK